MGFSQQAALAIKNAQRHELMLRKKEIDAELALCAQIQANFFPKEIPQPKGYEVFGSTVPCLEVGGDYYTFIPRRNGIYEAFQADVSGKGVAAALTVSEIHCAVNLLADSDASLADRTEALNRHLGRSLVAGRFATLLGLDLDPPTGALEAVVAGHPAPWIVSPDGSARAVARTRPVLGPGPFQRVKGTARKECLAPGELLVAFTDGYSEADTPAGELYGEKRVVDVVREVRRLDLPSIRSRLDAAVLEFQSGQPQADDMSLILLRRRA